MVLISRLHYNSYSQIDSKELHGKQTFPDKNPHPTAEDGIIRAGGGAKQTETSKRREPLTSSGVSLVSGWLWAARRAMAPARMLLRLIWRSGGGPPRGWPRTMMAQPDKTCGEEDEGGKTMTLRIDSQQNRCGDSGHKTREVTRTERRNERQLSVSVLTNVVKPDVSQASWRSKPNTRLNKS